MSEQEATAVLLTREDFVAKLDDEVYRSTRYEVPLSVVFLELASPGAAPVERTAELLIGQLRRLDFAGRLGERAYAVCLPHTPAVGAAVVVERLRSAFFNALPKVGFAAISEDAVDAEGLLRAAEGGAASREDP